nr:putative late blight resistance protein homolog R1B-23 [Ipomoea trifida]
MKLLRVLDLSLIKCWHGAPSEIAELVHLRYLALTTVGSLDKFELFKLRNLQTLIICSWREECCLQLPRDILDLPWLRHAHLDKRATVYLPNVIQESIQTLFWLKVNGLVPRTTNFAMVPNLKELGVYIDNDLPPGALDSLADLHLLERLKFERRNVEGFYLPTALPQNLKKLTLCNTYLSWEDMDIIGRLSKLEVLKLKEFAFSGPKWEPADDDGFKRLKLLLIARSDLKYWNTTDDHFPVLERLILRFCLDLEELPSEFANLNALQLIELENCYPILVESARKIQEEKQNYGNEALVIRDLGAKEKLHFLQAYLHKPKAAMITSDNPDHDEAVKRVDKEIRDVAMKAEDEIESKLGEIYQVQGEGEGVAVKEACEDLHRSLQQVVKDFEHVHFDKGSSYYLPNLVQENLQTLSWFKVTGRDSRTTNFTKVPNLKELGIYIEGEVLPNALDSLAQLHQLEKLKVKMGRVEQFNLPNCFPSNLKQLSLNNMYLSWEDMDIIGKLPNLDLLKLKDFAVCGLEWTPRDGQFLQLRFFLIERSDLEHWNAKANHFPALEHLILRYCWDLEKLPNDFEEVCTLRLIELGNCCSSLVTSAMEIQQAQRAMGYEGLVVRDVTKVSL